jgi:NADPH:quinone reductase-like Zn-dependent oxidoreductase
MFCSDTREDTHHREGCLRENVDEVVFIGLPGCIHIATILDSGSQGHLFLFVVRTELDPEELSMHAAVVTSHAQDPRYQEIPEPVPAGAHEIIVDVLAAGLSPVVRSKANGSHYSSSGILPLVPGVDGVGRDSDGVLHYFLLDDATIGSMAERTVIDRRRSVVLPADADPVAIAAGANPVMSSWAALRRRIDFRPGQSVLILGATGNSGRMAVQVARHLGASRVIAAGRNADRLAELGDAVDQVVQITDDLEATGRALADAAADVDVVIDYVWGPLTTAAMTAIVTDRPDRSRPLAWIEIGSVGGQGAVIPAAALRSSRLTLVGSGLGSVPAADLLAALAEIVQAIANGSLRVRATAVPLADVEDAWATNAGSDTRVVLVP